MTVATRTLRSRRSDVRTAREQLLDMGYTKVLHEDRPGAHYATACLNHSGVNIVLAAPNMDALLSVAQQVWTGVNG